MALPTAVCFALLFLALLASRRSPTWLHHFVGPGAGSATARRMLPILVIGPLCFAILQLSSAGYVIPNLGYAAITILLVFVSTVVVALNASIENEAERRARTLTLSLETSNKEKELLLAELHHRVKNNIQQAISIISMETATVEDREFKDKLRGLSSRIRSIGSVHELLMLSPTVSSIELQEFVARLADFMRLANALEARQIRLVDDVDRVTVPLDTAVTAGLLVAEIVMNSIKHAFPANGGGTIAISMKQKGTDLELIISDDGVGMAGSKPGGLGQKITRGPRPQAGRHDGRPF